VDLLNSSPEIHCDGEILRYKVPLPKLYARACSMKSKKSIYGFKVKLIHLTADQKLKNPEQFMADMHEQGWKIIYLKRTNVLRQEVSLQMTFHRKTLGHRQAWGHKVSDKPLKVKVPLDCGNLIQRLERREKFLQNEEKILKGLSHITLTYEGDLLHAENHQRTTDKLFDYLATPRVPVATQWAKSGKSELSTIIENYEEVSQTLAGTKYADLLLSD
jgi:hypothetical protein